MPIDTNLNIAPYYDDSDPVDNYYRILFQPLVPVQARELTGIQSMLQDQIEKFGSHVFKDGSVVNGCQPKPMENLDFVRLDDYFSVNVNRYITELNKDNLLVGATSGVRAVVVVATEGRTTLYPDTNTLHVKYISSGPAGQASFTSGEVINVYSINQSKIGTIDPDNLIDSINVLTEVLGKVATGKGYGLHIQDGMIFQKGVFQRVSEQTVIAKPYDNDVSNIVIGFNTVEKIITSDNDPSLLDNAAGYPNENAPGAHRLKLIPTLVAYDKTEIANNSSFFTIFEFSPIDNKLLMKNNDPTYNQLGDMMAQRTFEESGNYTTNPFLVDTANHSSNNESFNYIVDPGVAYVRGKRVEYLSSNYIEAPRAIETKEAIQQVITANYGNYVRVNELLGNFDFNGFETVDLYDTPQSVITNKNFGLTPTGTKIGTAQIHSVIHEEGAKGSPTAISLVYLFNIKMNSGYSFSNNVKSIHTSSASCDIKLVNDLAVLEETSKKSLVFSFGKNAIKRLRSANGTINRTEFITRATTNATLQANGFVQVTLPPAASGGVNQLPYSNGILGDNLEQEFDIVFTSNAVTADLSGTVTANSTSNTLVGSGTSFGSFSNNEFVQITSGATVDYRRVVSITSNTSMVLDSPTTVSNTSATYAKFFPKGFTVPLNNSFVGTRNVNITSPTSFEVNTGVGAGGNLSAPQTVIVNYNVNRTQAVQRKKEINKEIYVKLYANAAINSEWNLGLTDVLSISNIYAGNTYSTSNPDVRNYFNFKSGQKSEIYDHAKLILNPSKIGMLTDEKLLVKLSRFTSNNSGGIGFYSVDSYPVNDAVANTSTIKTYEIPVFTSDDGLTVDLRDAIDFRQSVADTANNSTTIGGATVNPASSNTYINTGYNPLPDTNFQADIEYYIGRVDLININSQGNLSLIKGTSSENPKTPSSDNDSMTIARSIVPPYPSLTSRELEQVPRLSYAIRTSVETSRGYNMRDISTLDERIKRLEYYTTLNLLEQKAKDTQITDANGLNRFKNGIFAEPFNSHAYGDTQNFEYRMAVDSNKGVGRPLFKSNNIDLKYDMSNSVGIKRVGDTISTDFDHYKLINQGFASKYRNCCGDYWNWTGSVNLYPPYDMNRDETKLPNSDVSIDMTQPFLDFANTITEATGVNIFGTRWGDWQNVVDKTTTSQHWSHTGPDAGWRFVDTTTTFSGDRAGSNTFIVPVTNNVSLGNFVKDISVQPYMKSRQIAFIARNLKPNTKMYVYFDTVPVSQYCASGSLNLHSYTKDDDIVVRSADWGAQLKTDETGTLIGKFLIPEGQFRVGDRTLKICDADSLVTGADAAITSTSAIFTASNIQMQTSEVSLNIKTPSIQSTSLEEHVNRVTTTTQKFFDDPIAQTYKVSAPNNKGGVFLSKLTLYFKSKDASMGVTVAIVPTVAGSPVDTSTITSKYLPSSAVNVSDDGSVGTDFEFPIAFNSDNSEYAFIVMPEGNSPEYKIFMAETGGVDLITGSQIYSNPYSGVALRSSNARTWTPIQNEDIKFDLYISKFKTTSSTLKLVNDDMDYVKYNTLAYTNANNYISVGDEVYPLNANNVISNTQISGVVHSIDTINNTLVIDTSTGDFAANNTLGIFRFPQHGNTATQNSTTLIGTCSITEVMNLPLHAGVARLSLANPLDTISSIEFKGYSNTGTIDSVPISLSPDIEKEFLDYERLVYSRSNAKALGIASSIKLDVKIDSSNEWLSPVINTSRKSFLAIENVINNDATDEHTNYGNALFKYVCTPITLADGQDAEDQLVTLTAWRPISTDIKVYCKLLNGEDSEKFGSKYWTEMTNNSPEVYSSSLNQNDFREYTFKLPFVSTNNSAYTNSSNYNVVEYQDSNGVIYSTYKTYAIKVVGLTTQKNIVPLFDSLTGLALQV